MIVIEDGCRKQGFLRKALDGEEARYSLCADWISV
jgi:hypothetical protein